MRSSAKARAKARAIDASIGRLTRALMRDAMPVMRALPRRVSTAMKAGQDVSAVVSETLNLLRPVIVDVLTVAHLRGRQATFRPVLALSAYTDAIDSLQRRAALSDADIESIRRMYGSRAVDVVSGMARDVQRKVLDAVADGLRQDLLLPDRIKLVQGALDSAGVTTTKPYQVETIVRTQTQTAYHAGRMNADKDPVVDEILWGYEYITVGDDRVRPEHAALDGFRAPKDDPVWNQITPPNGWNCFVPDTLVSGAFTGATRAFYDGPVAVIKTRNGARLTVTVNHPIATRRGWVAAQFLKHGDDLLSHLPTVKHVVSAAGNNAITPPLVPGRDINNNDVPSSIKNVFDTIGRNGTRAVTAQSAPLDFHGDAACFDGQIDVVLTDGELQRRQNAMRGDGVVKLVQQLVPDTTNPPSHCFGGLDFLGNSFCATSRGTPRSAALSVDNIAGVGTLLDDSPLDALLIGSAAELNTGVSENCVNRASGYTAFVRQLLYAGSGNIAFDDVVGVEIARYRGHVYDLQSVSSNTAGHGWMVAQGIVTSNCRCTVIEIFQGEELARATPYPEIDGSPVSADAGFDFNPGTVYRDILQTV